MEDETYVSFETAKLLKDKNFDKKVTRYYCSNGEKMWSSPSYNWNDSLHMYSAPTLGLAMEWLRKEKGLFIRVDVIREASCWMADVLDIFQDVKVWIVPDQCSSYEEICEAAIKYCLTQIDL